MPKGHLKVFRLGRIFIFWHFMVGGMVHLEEAIQLHLMHSVFCSNKQILLKRKA